MEKIMTTVDKRKRINIIFPGLIKQKIIVNSVNCTKDGKFILNYYIDQDGYLEEDYSEIINVDGKWCKYPFKKRFESYDFLEFDKIISDKVIEELPDEMRIKVYIPKNKKRSPRVIPELMRDMLLDSTGTRVIKEGKSIKKVYMVLLANDGNHSIIKKQQKNEYVFDFPFPVFSLPYSLKHKAYDNSSDVDENYDIEYNQKEYPRDEISSKVKEAVSKYFNEIDSNIIDIKELPVLEVLDNNELINICFVSCPSVKLYGEIYKCDCLTIDSDIPFNSDYDNLLDSALHNERPLIIGSNDGIVTNGVKHNIAKNENK